MVAEQTTIHGDDSFAFEYINQNRLSHVAVPGDGRDECNGRLVGKIETTSDI
jgi:hypothetical protein